MVTGDKPEHVQIPQSIWPECLVCGVLMRSLIKPFVLDISAAFFKLH